MISNIIVGNALVWWESNSGIVGGAAPKWRKARNEWLKAQGLSGVIKNGKKSKRIPPWWTNGTEFWFLDDINEQIFIDKWSNK